MNKLTEGLRQYRHNDYNGFVFGYDKEIIDRLFAALEQERDQLKAQNNLFRKAMKFAATNDMWESNGEFEEMFEYKYDCWYQDLLNKMLALGPAECVSEIQAKAIEDFYNKFRNNDPGQFFWPQSLLEYADKLRQQSKQGEGE